MAFWFSSLKSLCLIVSCLMKMILLFFEAVCNRIWIGICARLFKELHLGSRSPLASMKTLLHTDKLLPHNIPSLYVASVHHFKCERNLNRLLEDQAIWWREWTTWRLKAPFTRLDDLTDIFVDFRGFLHDVYIHCASKADVTKEKLAK